MNKIVYLTLSFLCLILLNINNKMKNQLTALVPVKGNSERVKNKNLKQFNGVPLCGIILQTLEDCDSVKEILIDTDSKEIAEYASSDFMKVKIIERPLEILHF